MLKQKLKILISCIDYVVNLVKNNKILILIYLFSFFFLLFFSPVLGIYFLVPCTIYFIYIKEFKTICLAWVFLIFSWYLAFTACMMGFDGPLIIKSDFLGCGPKSEETLAIISYIDSRYLSPVLSYSSFNDFWNATLGVFCMQSYFMLSILCSKLKISIYIPSLFKGLLTICKVIYKFIFRNNPPANCSPEKESGNSSIFSRMKNSFRWGKEKKNPTEPVNNQPGTSGCRSPGFSPGVSPGSIKYPGKPGLTNTASSSTSATTSYWSRFFSNNNPPKVSDWQECQRMENIISNNRGVFFNSDNTVVRGNCITYREFNLPPFDKWKNCNILKATSKEIEADKVFRESQNKSN